MTNLATNLASIARQFTDKTCFYVLNISFTGQVFEKLGVTPSYTSPTPARYAPDYTPLRCFRFTHYTNF
jgi:hypothetical protein